MFLHDSLTKWLSCRCQLYTPVVKIYHKKAKAYGLTYTMDPQEWACGLHPVNKTLSVYKPVASSNLSCFNSCIVVRGRIRWLEPRADHLSKAVIYIVDLQWDTDNNGSWIRIIPLIAITLSWIPAATIGTSRLMNVCSFSIASVTSVDFLKSTFEYWTRSYHQPSYRVNSGCSY